MTSATKDKGKAIALGVEAEAAAAAAAATETKSDPNDGQQKTLGARIADSASGLLRDSLSANNCQNSSSLSGFLTQQAKPGSSQSPPFSGSAEFLSHESSGPSTLAPTHGTNRDYASFRESRPNENGVGTSFQFPAQNAESNRLIDLEEEASVSSLQSSDSVDTRVTSVSTSLGGIVVPYEFGPTPSNHYRLSAPTTYLKSFINPKDGTEVIDLLRDPRFEFETSFDATFRPAQPTISRLDMEIAEEIARLMENAETPKPKTVFPLNGPEPLLSPGEAVPSTGSTLTSFFQQIENYQDEVWGYIESLLIDAKREIRNSAGSAVRGGPATRRLRMIYNHIVTSA